MQKLRASTEWSDVTACLGVLFACWGLYELVGLSWLALIAGLFMVAVSIVHQLGARR